MKKTSIVIRKSKIGAIVLAQVGYDNLIDLTQYDAPNHDGHKWDEIQKAEYLRITTIPALKKRK